MYDKGHVIQTEEGIPHSKVDSEVTIYQEDHKEDNYSNKGDRRHQRFSSKSISPARRPGTASRSLSRDKDRCFNSISNFAKQFPEKQHL